MITFCVALVALVLGYLIYGKFVESIFGIEPNRKTPCYTKADGVDYLPMPSWKVFLIQFLNIAGTGPIFGAIMGILYGPAAYLWIVLGCIFGGAVHDFLGGMISLRKGGASLPEIIGDELGNTARLVMRIFSLVLMILVGAVFAYSPAKLLGGMTNEALGFDSVYMWTCIIFSYYVLATLMPIDKLIGKLYPVFGLALIFMAVGVGTGIFFNPGEMPEITDAFVNHNPSKDVPLFPGICITIACGAVSGFHATQSPMMARCMKNEPLGRKVFYGAMITEGLVAVIWAAAAIKFADSLNVAGNTPYEKLATAMDGNPAAIVNMICNSWLGWFGATLAILGVVAAPITSGDTALRCARLIAADFVKIEQKSITKRLTLCLPIFAIAICIVIWSITNPGGFNVIWRYFAWTNQTLAVFTLWAITTYLSRRRKFYWVGLIPAFFMTVVCSSYILLAKEGFGLPQLPSILVGVGIAVICSILFLMKTAQWKKAPQLHD